MGTQKDKKKVHLLPGIGQGETFDQYHKILKTIIGRCLDTMEFLKQHQAFKSHF